MMRGVFALRFMHRLSLSSKGAWTSKLRGFEKKTEKLEVINGGTIFVDRGNSRHTR